jgi:hypothetical protein
LIELVAPIGYDIEQLISPLQDILREATCNQVKLEDCWVAEFTDNGEVIEGSPD